MWCHICNVYVSALDALSEGASMGGVVLVAYRVERDDVIFCEDPKGQDRMHGPVVLDKHLWMDRWTALGFMGCE